MAPLAMFWTCTQGTCDVLRAVTILSSASFASCLAIMSSCEVWVEAMASPNTPSRLTSPTVSTAIEITTSSSENPSSARFAILEFLPRLFIDVPIDIPPTHCCRSAIRECGLSRPTEILLASSAGLPHARCTPRLHPNCPHNFRCCHPAPYRPGRSKVSVLLRCRLPCSQSQSPAVRSRSRPEPPRGTPIAQRTTHRSAIGRSRYSAPPEIGRAHV